jgi:hypothetical protein
MLKARIGKPAYDHGPEQFMGVWRPCGKLRKDAKIEDGVNRSIGDWFGETYGSDLVGFDPAFVEWCYSFPSTIEKRDPKDFGRRETLSIGQYAKV